MKRYIVMIMAAVAVAFGAKADLQADWKTYMPFDAWPVQIVETPTRVYTLSRTFQKASNLPERAVPSHSLFYYDKEGDEIVSVNERMNANGNAVASIAYNATKKYLIVVYTDCNIDFIYDDGRVFNVPALKITSVPGKKEANSITIDNANSRAYVATTFGYIALNDEKHEVAESRIYGEDIQSIGRTGDNIVLSTHGQLYYAPAKEQRYNLGDYKAIEGSPAFNTIIPFDGGRFLAFNADGNTKIDLFTYTDGAYKWEEITEDPQVWCWQQTPGGYLVTGNVRMFSFDRNGAYTTFNRPEEDWREPATSLNGTQIWCLASRKGIRSYSRSGGNTSLTRDYMRPNAPATYISSALAYSPTYGMMSGSNGVDYAYSNFSQATPTNVSALKGGFWKEYGWNYSGNTAFSEPNNYGGMSLDPQNPNHLYRTSALGGLMRINLADPKDILILANPSNLNAGKEGFVKVADDLAAWNILCHFTPPRFTADGTMWSSYFNADTDKAELWYWTAADRLATTSAANYRPMKKIELPKFTAGNSDCMITLTRNKNMVVVSGFQNDGTILIYDHNGTPDNTSDDRYVFMNNFYDQDGGGVKFLAVNDLYEDPQTGLVWILSQRGVFTLNPVTAFEDPTRVNRIKVARNDGTNLADYLLNEINVHSMTSDGEGRKWFATSNGLVCTSNDGRTILAEFTTDNSYLPSNAVYASCYNPENNSMMVATGGGLVEMFPSGSGGSQTSEGQGVRAYPNPVEPDYYGWVRIDNVADGSLVKITDSSGGIVKELGPAQGGSVEWDVSGYNNRRVSTGVYYIMVSPGSAGGNTQVSKILVLN